MCKEQRFQSILAPFINGLLAEKRSMGFDYRTEELILLRFDRYCTESGLAALNVKKDFLDKWCTQTDTEGLSYLRKRITTIRQLMLYMISLGIMVYLPKSNGRREIVLPHIFTQEELTAFFHEADSYEPRCNRAAAKRLAKEYMVLFRLLYCCGLRNSEGCSIAADQVDLTNGILTILDSKGNKDRLVYMADDLTGLCREYFEYLCNALSYKPIWFFPGKNPEKPLRNTSIDRVFNRFWSGTAFAASCNNKPTVHDLRFSFVTDRINLWAMEGVDINVMMPYLQKYLGHRNLQDSYYYYHNSRQLYDAIRIKDKTVSTVIPEVPDYE
ncbi:MAG: tyrosine-type recombinase/integrase [Eubacteriales bacterium]|nr:tyrosine-type recombinase/integrase [Eubacteriales bacterium]